jgi:hypothetical protein
MKKRILSLILALCLVAALLPTGVLAADNGGQITTASVSPTSLGTLMDNIAATYAASTDAWVVLDMAAYGKNVKSGAYESSDAPSALAEAAIGGDASASLESLKNFDPNGDWAIYTTPFALLAYDAADLDDTGLTNTRAGMKSSMLDYLSDLEGNFASADSVAPILNALAPYYKQGDTALDTAVDSTISWLSQQQLADGTFESYGSGNSDSTALVIVALAAYGIDANTDARFVKESGSALTGLLSFAISSLDGFGYTDNTEKNDYATEQSFRALVAYAQFQKVGAYNLYLDAHATSEPSGTVSFVLTGDTTWISEAAIALSSDVRTVGDVFDQILTANGYQCVGLTDGYIRSITTPSGVTLGEFSDGDYSGWMYKVNGEMPNVGFRDYTLSAGDEIVLFYVKDYRTLYYGDTSSTSFSDVSGHWAESAIAQAAAAGLIVGNTDGTFAPDRNATRAAAVTMLYRLVGEPTATDAVNWAKGAGILRGSTDGSLRLGETVTRQQFITMLYRCANVSATTGDVLGSFADADDVADYARDAMNWAVAQGILVGSNSKLNPQATLTRAQAATILVRALPLFAA